MPDLQVKWSDRYDSALERMVIICGGVYPRDVALNIAHKILDLIACDCEKYRSHNQQPPVPKDGWTVETLRAAMLGFPQDAPIKVFCSFDTEGPNTWAPPRIAIVDGQMRIEP